MVIKLNKRKCVSCDDEERWTFVLMCIEHILVVSVNLVVSVIYDLYWK